MHKIFSKLFIFSILFVGSYSYAQTTANSPYSQFGLGHILNNSSAIETAMGGITNGLRFEDAINSQNPASYNALKYTTFAVGVFGSSTTLQNSTGIGYRNNASLSYLKIGFPISKKWGASFGLVPVTGMGYDSKTLTTTADTPVYQVYKGNGGLSKFYIGTSVEIIKGLSIGVNATYLFGNINKTKANEFPDSLKFQNIRQTNSTYIGSMFLNYGIQYTMPLDDDKTLTIGFSGNPTSSLSATENTLGVRYTYGPFKNEVVTDTVEQSKDKTGRIVFPMFNSFGFSIAKEYKWKVGADISLGQWSNLEVFGKNQNLKNSMNIAVGGMIIPNHNAVGNYFKLLEYRAGLNYYNSYIDIGGQEINQISATFGMGLPLPKTASKINLALEVGKRGTMNNGLIEEDFVSIHAGFNFCDRWFVRRKYD